MPQKSRIFHSQKFCFHIKNGSEDGHDGLTAGDKLLHAGGLITIWSRIKTIVCIVQLILQRA